MTTPPPLGPNQVEVVAKVTGHVAVADDFAQPMAELRYKLERLLEVSGGDVGQLVELDVQYAIVGRAVARKHGTGKQELGG